MLRGPQEQPPEWVIIYDPSGDFKVGEATFTMYDLKAGCSPNTRVWEFGTIFKNLITGKKAKVVRPARFRFINAAKLVKYV